MTENAKEQIWEIYNYFLENHESNNKKHVADGSSFALSEAYKSEVVSYIQKLDFMVKNYRAINLVPEPYQQSILGLFKKEGVLFDKDMKSTTMLSSFIDYFKKNVSTSVLCQELSAVFYFLKEIALMALYVCLCDSGADDLICQINKAIALDAMDGKYMHRHDLKLLIDTINSKALLSYSKWCGSVLRTIGMLNYKAHNYSKSIFFFEEYLNKEKITDSAERIRIQIYIGYCYEKDKKFDEAITLFERLVRDCASNESLTKEFLIEINHGLGHFYNERAVFSSPRRTPEQITADIIMGRNYLRQALSQRIDYLSCYGSLFHEYGDYHTAMEIFTYAKAQEGISSNSELNSEMLFYYAQTTMILATDDEHTKLATEAFEKFEKHCRDTYNYDGIAHARIFKAKLAMRKLKLLPERKNVASQKQVIEDHIIKVSEYPLSIYASKSIKDEYEKIQNTLRIYLYFCRSTFCFEYTEVQHYINQFYGNMLATITDHEFHSSAKAMTRELPLFSIKVNNMQLLGIGDKSIIRDYIIEQEKKKGSGSQFIVDQLRPITNLVDFQAYLCSNSRPDALIVVPSVSTAADFEELKVPYCLDHEDTIYILLDSQPYDIAWLKDLYRAESRTENLNDERCCPRHTVEDVLRIAFCLRGLELLKKDLLAPMPLFSLAPTHFSESYNYQLGEVLQIILHQNSDPSGRIIGGLLQSAISTQEEKYAELLKAQLNYNFFDGFATLSPCVDERALFACCFNPDDDISEGDGVKTISFSVMDTAFRECHIALQLYNINQYYSCKALEDYSDVLSELKSTFRYDTTCETGRCEQPCQVCVTGNVDDDKATVPRVHLVNRLLSYIIGDEVSDYRYEYKIIKKDATHDSKIVLFLLSPDIKRKRSVASVSMETIPENTKGKPVSFPMPECPAPYIIKYRKGRSTMTSFQPENNPLFLFVTANEHETNALLEDKGFFDHTPKIRSSIPSDGMFYNCGKFGAYKAVHFELPDQGSVKVGASLPSILTAIDAWNPDAVILVGISFGKDNESKPEPRQHIGDVLISKQIVDYESGKIKDGKMHSDGSRPDCGFHLRTIFQEYSKSWRYLINSRQTKCEFGLLLSGDKVIDDHDFKEQLFAAYPRAMGGEMEGRGAYTACQSRNVSEWIVVKAICDWGENKNDPNKEKNQITAARSAVSFLKHVFFDPKAFAKLPVRPALLKQAGLANQNLTINNSPKSPQMAKSASPIRVFVTYCWTPKPHQQNVFKFVDNLRSKGFDAVQDFDIMQSENNLQKMMTIGFSYDKVVVVLSEEYKRRADELIGGVGQEAPMIADQKKAKPSKFVFVSLDSITSGIVDRICPSLFAGENIIDMTSNDEMNGWNLLVAKLIDESLIDRNPVASVSPTVKKVHRA